MTTRAVVFDCFGVLISDKLIDLFKQYTANDPQKFEQFLMLCQQADRGLLPSSQYWQAVAALMNLTVEQCHQTIDAERHPNYDLIAYIRELKESQRLKIGLLSNAGEDIWQYITPDLQELFDIRLISAQLGRCKPDQEVYLEMCRQLGVGPEEAVMVDDSYNNCIGAQKTGMRAVQYQSFTQLRGELSDAIVVL